MVQPNDRRRGVRSPKGQTRWAVTDLQVDRTLAAQSFADYLALRLTVSSLMRQPSQIREQP